MALTIIMTAHDRSNGRNLYMKADGRRFSSSQTVKICSDVKYDVTVTVKPSMQKLEKLIIGGEEIPPDSMKDCDNNGEYKFTWITSGYKPTKSGQRFELNFCFKFEKAEVAKKFQVKFYPQEKASHITWGTEINRIEMSVRGMESTSAASDSLFMNLVPTEVTFK